MQCPNCSNPLNENARFCNNCGARVAHETPPEEKNSPVADFNWDENAARQAPQQGTPAYTQTYAQTYTQQDAPMYTQQGYESGNAYYAGQPEEKKAGGKKKLIIMIAAILVVALAAVLIFVDFRSPAVKAHDSIKATFNALQEYNENALEEIGFNAIINQMLESPVSAQYSAKIPDPSGMFPGDIMISSQSKSDLSARRIQTSIGVGASGMTLAQLQIDIDDNKLMLSMPQLLRHTYGIHTDTFGRDFLKSPLSEDVDEETQSALGSLSLNLIDLTKGMLEASVKKEEKDKELEKKTDALGKALWDSSKIKSEGSVSRRINGEDVKCELLSAELTSDALIEYIKGIGEAYIYASDIDEMMRSMPNAQFNGVTSAEDLMDQMHTAFDELARSAKGSITLRIYTAKGLCRAIEIEIQEKGSSAGALVVEFGAKEIGDALSVSMKDEYGDRLGAIEVRGGLKPQNGTVQIEAMILGDKYDDEPVSLFELRWDMNKPFDNFNMRLVPQNGGDFHMQAAGTAIVNKQNKSMTLDLYDIMLSNYGDVTFLGFSYEIAPLKNVDFAPVKPDFMLFELTEDALQDLAMEAMDNLSELYME